MAQPRRSQAERTKATIGRLIDATVAAVIEEGYEGATTRAIGQRSHISQGGLFRHFRSRKQLVLAAVARVHERQLAALDAVRTDDPAQLLAELAAILRAPEGVVPVEVSLAARTDDELREGLRPLVRAHRQALTDRFAARQAFARLPRAALETWLTIAVHGFQAEALWVDVDPTELGDVKHELLLELLDQLAGGSATEA